MTNNTHPMVAPLIIASLSIGRPSEDAITAILDLIDRFGSDLTIDDCHSIMRSALALEDPMISTLIADALNVAAGING